MEIRLTTFTLTIVLLVSFALLIVAFRFVVRKEQSKSYSGAKFVINTDAQMEGSCHG